MSLALTAVLMVVVFSIIAGVICDAFAEQEFREDNVFVGFGVTVLSVLFLMVAVSSVPVTTSYNFIELTEFELLSLQAGVIVLVYLGCDG